MANYSFDPFFLATKLRGYREVRISHQDGKMSTCRMENPI